ncbi:MAG: addiction module protein [Okeania sp. SIO2D1]|uniref:addiction module protein n=1 Tax=Okeania sp. SIO2C9 TaxID=2607791 RepID=UPI0013B90400|nr:addiction module protein [Okeania sp. SIO2C9]NEQ76343.1 addiction module protein [Okeania sp. SIO2C9]NES69832.1 addiction module protein [Okeania sp. SIO2D1]
MLSVEEIIKEALSLPNIQRSLLVEKLIESMEFDIDETIQTTWINEAKKRRNEIKNGDVLPIPGEEALAEVRRILE